MQTPLIALTAFPFKTIVKYVEVGTRDKSNMLSCG